MQGMLYATSPYERGHEAASHLGPSLAYITQTLWRMKVNGDRFRPLFG